MFVLFYSLTDVQMARSDSLDCCFDKCRLINTHNNVYDKVISMGTALTACAN